MPMQKLVACFFLISALLIAGCGTQPTERPEDPEPEQSLSLAELERRVGAYLETARGSESPERERELLAAAELLLNNQQPDWARNILQSIPPGALSDTDYSRYIDLYSSAAISSGRYLKAQELLDSDRLKRLPLSAEQDQLLSERRATVESRLGNYNAALSERIRLGQRLDDPDDTEFNNEAIWQDLMSLSTEELQTLVRNNSRALEQGWAALALVARNNAANLNAQLAQLEQWQRQWIDHPANDHLPTDLQLLRQIINQQPRQIALLLPQQGRLANAAAAVRDGFLAAYYAAPLGATRPDIHHYDTSGDNIVEVYHQAVADGADMIIGPLDKNHVYTLANAELTRPVLALNTLDSEARREAAVTIDHSSDGNGNNKDETPEYSVILAPASLLPNTPLPPATDLAAPLEENRLFAPRLYQFGLAAEDEARQVARFASLEGHRNAMIIVADTDWASRSADAFTDEWQAMGGRVLARSSFIGTGDYSAVIKQALLVDQSEERHRQLRAILGHGSEFEPRRRQDVDMLFLVATPPQARQIKPTLAFHYAGNLPVYATSQVFTGEFSGADSDLAGIRFNTLPWQFDNDSPEKRALDQHAEAPAAYGRLQAMGVDAYHLYPRLPQLRQLDRARVFGATGHLSLNAEGRIERELIWARFSRDGAELLPAVIDQPIDDER